jgi:hypothetical protein
VREIAPHLKFGIDVLGRSGKAVAASRHLFEQFTRLRPPALSDQPAGVSERTSDKSVLRLDEIIGFYSKVARLIGPATPAALAAIAASR